MQAHKPSGATQFCSRTRCPTRTSSSPLLLLFSKSESSTPLIATMTIMVWELSLKTRLTISSKTVSRQTKRTLKTTRWMKKSSLLTQIRNWMSKLVLISMANKRRQNSSRSMKSLASEIPPPKHLASRPHQRRPNLDALKPMRWRCRLSLMIVCSLPRNLLSSWRWLRQANKLQTNCLVVRLARVR